MGNSSRLVPAVLAATVFVGIAGCGGSGTGSTASFCTLAKAEEKAQAGGSDALESDTPTQLQSYLSKTVSALDAFVAAAPSSIKPAVTVVDTAFKNLANDLKNAGYEVKNLNTTDLQGFDSESVQSAAGQVTGYLKKNCGIKNP